MNKELSNVNMDLFSSKIAEISRTQKQCTHIKFLNYTNLFFHNTCCEFAEYANLHYDKVYDKGMFYDLSV